MPRKWSNPVREACSRKTGSPAVKRFASWAFLLMAIATQLQGVLLLPQQLVKPAHFHRSVGAGQAPTTGPLATWLVDVVSEFFDGHHHSHALRQHGALVPAAAGQPAGLQSNGDAHRHAASSNHHDHDLHDPTVVYVETDNAAPGAADTPRHTGLDPYWAILPPAPSLNLVRADDQTDPFPPRQRPSISAGAAERPPRA